MTQAEHIANYFIAKKQTLTIAAIYDAFPQFPKPSIRRVLRRDPKKRFKAIAKGLYFLNTEEAQAILVEGDSRNLAMLEDKSIDLIVADHPWEDKKALKGGNRHFSKDYAEHSFLYTLEDFKEKARVLKDGAYLVEIIPAESHTNFHYLYQLKQMALEAGFSYYAKIMWEKKPSNTGRTVKDYEDVMIFSKGPARRINDGSRKQPYKTREMLRRAIYAPVPKNNKQKNHQSEKPVALWCYLFAMLTHPLDVIVDQFGGSCNTISAALALSRNILAFELMDTVAERAAVRIGMEKLAF